MYELDLVGLSESIQKLDQPNSTTRKLVKTQHDAQASENVEFLAIIH